MSLLGNLAILDREKAKSTVDRSDMQLTSQKTVPDFKQTWRFLALKSVPYDILQFKFYHSYMTIHNLVQRDFQFIKKLYFMILQFLSKWTAVR